MLPYDPERVQALVYLSPLSHLTHWLVWAWNKTQKTPNTHGYVTLFVHFVKVDPNELIILENRYWEEYAVSRALHVLKVLPIRFYIKEIQHLSNTELLVHGSHCDPSKIYEKMKLVKKQNRF